MTKANFRSITGPIAITIGVILMMGALMVLLVTAMFSKFPRAFLISGTVQLVLGLVGTFARPVPS